MAVAIAGAIIIVLIAVVTSAPAGHKHKAIRVAHQNRGISKRNYSHSIELLGVTGSVAKLVNSF